MYHVWFIFDGSDGVSFMLKKFIANSNLRKIISSLSQLFL